jgi:hypothetical protein
MLKFQDFILENTVFKESIIVWSGLL